MAAMEVDYIALLINSLIEKLHERVEQQAPGIKYRNDDHG